MSQKDIFELRNVGVMSREEITKAIEGIIQSGKVVHHERKEEPETVIETTPESSRLSELLPEIESISLDDVPFSVRARNALRRANVQTASELVQMSEKDIMSLRNVGAQTKDEILAIIDVIIRDGRDYFDNLTSQDNQELGNEPIVESAGKGFDFAVIDILIERFVFKPAKMTEWFGLSRQSVYNALEKRLPQRRSTWTGKTICESELSILTELIENKSFDYTDDEVTCCCMNNKQDDFVCLFIYENEIKCFFLNDLPDEIREQVVVKKMHMYTERELAGESDGRVINVLTKPFYRPDNPERFRANAQLRGMTTDEYAVFISGYPYLDQRSITDDYELPIPDGMPDAEYLYDLCVSASVYRDLRRITSHPMTIPEITRALRATHDVTQQDVVNIIGVAAQASKNKSALIKARYHMFAKALEGAYVTLGQNKKLMLNRNRSITIGDEDWKVFECAICDDCGRVAVAGKDVDGKLEFANSSYDPNIEYYLLRDNRDVDLNINEEDEDDTEEIGKNDYLLCSKCGALIHESLKADPPCTCGLNHYVKLRKARKSGSHGDGKCPSCNFGTFKTFYLGYNAATAVLGTSLFEELPESEKVLRSKKSTQPVKKSLFGAAKQGPQIDIVRRKRQFLSFSDSRGEAAFFASYMTASYSEFLRRRGIWHVVENNKENMAAHPWEIQHFVDELTSYFDSCRTFAEPGDKGVENLTATSRKNAWIAVLNEMVNARRSTSLASLGIIKFNYKGNTEEIMSGVAETYQQKIEDVKALFDLLAMEIVYHGALEGDCDLTDDEREYIRISYDLVGFIPVEELMKEGKA